MKSFIAISLSLSLILCPIASSYVTISLILIFSRAVVFSFLLKLCHIIVFFIVLFIIFFVICDYYYFCVFIWHLIGIL